MTIDIITYTDAQFAALTEEQILEVQRVQMKKNALTERLKERKRAEKFKLLKAGVFRSAIWQKYCDGLDATYDLEVENLRDGLLFYLRFAAKPPAETPAPSYTVDYSLTYNERFNQVRSFYDENYTDPGQKFTAFCEDKVAPSYLGELYAPLFNYYQQQAE